MRQRTILLLAAAATVALPAAVEAQLAVTPRALGMGDAYVAVARGQESLFLNPANVGLRGTPYWSISIPLFGLAQSAEGIGPAEMRDMTINRKSIDDARKQEILDGMPPEGTSLDLQSSLPGISVQAGNLLFGVAWRSHIHHGLGRDIVELFFEGYDRERTNYTVGETTQGSSSDWWDVAVGYGRRIGPLSLGATGHYYIGRQRSRSRMFEPRIDPEAQTIEVDYVGVVARGGSGFGLDVGAAMQPIPILSLSASITNIASQMNWGETLRMRSVTLTNSDFDHLEWNEVLTQFEQSEHDVDYDSAPQQFFVVADDLYEGGTFPATLRLGASLSLPTGTTVAAAYRGNLTEGGLGAWWDRSLGVGVQQRLFILTARAGYATDMDTGNMLTGGLSLGPLDLGVARLLRSERDGLREPGIVASVGLSVGTPTLRY